MSADQSIPSANPLGLNGFEFVEFTSPDPAAMGAQFEALGFTPTHRHPTKNVTRYKQGRINLMLNRDEAGRVAAFRGMHGPSASAMASSSSRLAASSSVTSQLTPSILAVPSLSR